MLGESDVRALVRMQRHWEGHYRIWIIDEIWYARRKRHDHETLMGRSSSELWDQLRDDYAELAEHEEQLRLTAAGTDQRAISRADMTSLNWLRMHYETQYQIDFVRPDRNAEFWQAVWLGEGQPVTLVADNPIRLRDAMRDDISHRRSGALQADI